jgi:hypothetical protein
MTTFTGLPPVQVLLSQMTRDDFFAHKKGMPKALSEGTPLVISLTNLSAEKSK